MKFILGFLLLFCAIANAQVIIKSTENNISFAINPQQVLEANDQSNINTYEEINMPQVKYLSYYFVSPSKKKGVDFDVRLSVGKQLSKAINLSAGRDNKGNGGLLSKNFQKPFYEISYQKEISGLYVYKIDIFPFRYNVLNKQLSFNKFLNIDVKFSQSLSSKYKNINLPQKDMLNSVIINLSKIDFAKNTSGSVYLTKEMSTSDEIIATDFANDSINLDYLIITAEEFISQAKELCFHRKNYSDDDVLSPKYITTKTIYSLFEASHSTSFQPKAKSIQSAILKLKQLSKEKLTFVVIIGSGFVEYWAQQRENFVPVYSEKQEKDPAAIGHYLVSDDYMTVPDSLHRLVYPKTIFIGRLPARDVEDAQNLVDKIIASDNYENYKGSWKNSIQILADDDMQGSSPDPISKPHENFLEEYVIPSIPEYVEKQRVYMNLHPRDNNYKKPTATRDMISGINNGILMSVYSGHGGATVLSDEQLFSTDNISSLKNKYYPIFIFLSCQVGAIHGINESLSEVLVNEKDYGTDMVFAASEETYPVSNNLLGGYLIDILYKNEGKSMGEMINEAKTKGDLLTALAYQFFGDPASKFKLPIPIELASNDTIYPFEKATTSTRVPSGIFQYEYKFYDALKYVKYITDQYQKQVSYTENGLQLYKNSSSTTSGIVSESFIVPKNIKVNDSTAGYTLYLSDNKENEFLYYDLSFNSKPPQNYGGNNIDNINGPTIEFFQVNSVTIGALQKETTSPLHNSDELKLPAVVKVTVKDNDGVYLNGNYLLDAGYGGIPYSWDNKTSSYAYEQYNKDNGSFSLQLDSTSFAGGLHKLTVSAVDVKGNISKKDISLNIVTPNSTRLISRIYTYPNPGKLPIKIVYQLLDKIYEGKILIYDSRGRILKSFKFLDGNTRVGFNHITWDGTVGNGKKIGKGLYIAQVIVYKDAEAKAENIKQSKKFKFIIE